ncbi:MAG: NAD-dependent epimerase/dehydratase family protein [Acidimicrobiia bacterium]
MKAFITGGAGFIGSTLADRLLADGWSVDVADDLSSGSLANLADARSVGDRRFSFHRIDIRNAAITELIESRKPDVVFHLAAQADVRVSVAKPQFDAEVNLIGALNVFQGALAGKVKKVVFASSGGTIYGTPTQIPTPETHPQRPESPYGVAKKAGGDYLHYYRQIHGLDFAATAFSNVYGPRQDPHGEAGVVAIFTGLFLERRRPTIFGSGDQTRDFVYVDDVVDALTRAAERGEGIINIGTGDETSVNDLYASMSRATGYTDPPNYAAARAGELDRSALAIDRAGTELGWKPFTSLDEGVSRTIEWFRERRG